MTLDLDKRQRAMLREMGVRVWQPSAAARAASADESAQAVMAPPAPAQAAPPARALQPAVTLDAINSIAGRGPDAGAPDTFRSDVAPVAAPAAPVSPPPSRREGGGSSQALWSVGEALPLYAADAPAGAARWLVLAETPASALGAASFNPFDGDAGKLLDNMLRAAGLHTAGAVQLAPLVRQAPMGAAGASLAAALPGLLAAARPDVVLVMGRLAAQAVLQSGEVFGKLRGQVHLLQGMKTVVTHDAAYLLRLPADKAKAWDDLCLAMSIAASPRA